MDSPTETGLEISDDSCGWPQNGNSFEEMSSGGSDQNASSPVTPESDRIPVALSFDHGNSDVSPNHDYDSSYSELDSEAEAFYSSLNHHLVSPGTMDTHEFAEKQISYGELMKKFVQCEEELRATSLKLQDSEQEIEKLKGETEMRESAVVPAEDLCAELEIARREIEAKNTEIEAEKKRALELQRQVVDLESTLSDSRFNIGNIVDELQWSRECLGVSDAEISKLKESLCDCQQNFSTEKTKLETNVAGLLEKQTFLEARVKELESRGQVLEDQIRHSDAEKMEMQRKEAQGQAEIDALKIDLASRDERIEALNKDFDKHKLSYDMLMAEKDGVCAEVDNLKAEMRSRDIQIEQIEDQLNQLRCRQTELVSESGTAKNTVEELRGVVKELEKQAELQRNAISEGEEEKREAIRQLCFSLDHYKSGYRQLLRFLSSNKMQ
ncbi:hypothetical protein EUTSA_v10013570mg [Eutrema salsugineum]|uniref:NAB domain-containing protein n=1 Tax=Eutrema salsugineum TaxID=72664 RepID=V4LKT1_EUTSA|nr:protein NETWORKED 4B [Eutrema salsugineum]ESQ40433.1 hypothetical protein EUTSA_v10013570mg [Eutrema salsugineum]